MRLKWRFISPLILDEQSWQGVVLVVFLLDSDTPDTFLNPQVLCTPSLSKQAPSYILMPTFPPVKYDVKLCPGGKLATIAFVLNCHRYRRSTIKSIWILVTTRPTLWTVLIFSKVVPHQSITLLSSMNASKFSCTDISATPNHHLLSPDVELVFSSDILVI